VEEKNAAGVGKWKKKCAALKSVLLMSVAVLKTASAELCKTLAIQSMLLQCVHALSLCLSLFAQLLLPSLLSVAKDKPVAAWFVSANNEQPVQPVHVVQTV
jgi:hypothetical protein